MARRDVLVLRRATFLFVRLRGEQVAVTRRAAQELPVAVSLKRLATDFLVFCMGMTPTSGAGENK